MKSSRRHPLIVIAKSGRLVIPDRPDTGLRTNSEADEKVLSVNLRFLGVLGTCVGCRGSGARGLIYMPHVTAPSASTEARRRR